ncbi:NAD(P)/FAD-dependent oxidoreductase [Planctomycetales bacterium ZRK34]|nr:NAD(P)/FAD-dependent oxidoreductase [Planctomycetales bacterium ZRK34]
MTQKADPNTKPRTLIVGGGFTGLAAAYELARAGLPVTVLEADPDVGGLAGSFDVDGVSLERFYHHWFTNDRHVMDLIEELGQQDRILLRPTRTGMYYANNFYRLSTPKDLLTFKPLGFIDRVRLGYLALKARRVKDWMALEDITARQWLIDMAGENVYRVVWEPLMAGKFGPFADKISAVWMWNKLKLRGGSRGKGAAEMLAYYRGGFASLAQSLADEIVKHGGEILTNHPVNELHITDNRVTGLRAAGKDFEADRVLLTTPLPIAADLIQPHADAAYVDSLRRIEYLANVCLVLELDRSLSETYWLNVNDPSFPYVAVIEHTNFEPPETYHGKRIVYLSKYLPADAELYRMSDEQVFEFSLPHIQRMFPDFDRSWVQGHHVWRARYSQPIVGKHYSKLIPAERMPVDGMYLATMAQIYPEDRGTNYAIREGRAVGKRLVESVS